MPLVLVPNQSIIRKTLDEALSFPPISSADQPTFTRAFQLPTTKRTSYSHIIFLSYCRMFPSTLRLGAARIAQHAPRHLTRMTPASSFAASKIVGSVRSLTSEQAQHFQQLGYLDEESRMVYDTLHELQVRTCDVYADNEVFGTYNAKDDDFEWMTYSEFANKVNNARAVLRDIGVPEFGKVAIISNNRWEWAALATAAYSINASFVPMYEAQLPGDWTYILNDSGSCAVFCANQTIYETLQKEVIPSTPGVQSVLCLDAAEGEPHAFATAMASVKPDTEGSLILRPTPEDLANLIYTSGTTGKPKGVELTHSNSATNARAPGYSSEDAKNLMKEDDRTLAFLPWAHSYGQTCELWLTMANGGSLGICRGVPMILEDLQMVRPTVLYSVPTLYKKIFDGVHNMMETASPLRKSMMKNALAIGDANAAFLRGDRGPLSPMEKIKHSVLDKVVLSKIRSRFGGRMNHGFVAGSACAPEVVAFMDSLGIPICEGYGLTETSPIISLNVPNQRQKGSVGRPVDGVDVYIIDGDGNPVPDGQEGEICCVGPNVMRGYHNNPEATAEVISVAPDGKSRMFHTGDLGRVDPDGGWLHITGRLKEQYKLENGKYVVPTPIEVSIGMSRFIAQVVLCGANRPHNVALIVPEWAAIRSELNIEGDVSEEDLANDGRVKELIDSEIASNCKALKKFEIPTGWAFVAPFTAANNMLTPKMSIRRHQVIQTYAEVIDGLYGIESNDTQASDNARAA
eukprot:Nitzschia sp. Nitz4//scaffold22_size323478//278027//280476//NITZ4_000581-RA/size323478-augustus-gene-0.211-mRNA-1//1//CDS//3329543159//8111//frame0